MLRNVKIRSFSTFFFKTNKTNPSTVSHEKCLSKFIQPKLKNLQKQKKKLCQLQFVIGEEPSWPVESSAHCNSWAMSSSRSLPHC